MTSNDATPEEVERAKRWAAMQAPPVTVFELNRPDCDPSYGYGPIPNGLSDLICVREFDTKEWAWSELTVRIRPYFASLAPVLFEEAAKHMDDCASLSSNPHMIQAYKHAAFSLRRLAAGETTP